MASISNDPGGRKRLQFVDAQGNRKAIRLGKVTQRAAETIAVRVEQLVSAQITGAAIDGETSRWLAGLDPRLAAKLVKVGLMQTPEAKPSVTLAGFVDSYINGREDVKPASKLVWQQVRRNLVEYFGAKRNVVDITAGDADDFKAWLATQGLAATTVHKRLQFARTFFRSMQRRRLITENPFADVKAPAGTTKDRQRFVTREETDRLLAACPNHDWRTIVALARYGGLRCPSEVLSLRISDIDVEQERIVVQSPKTEHHTGRETRVIPLFPELLTVLQEAFDRAPEGAVYIVNEKYRKAAMGPGGWANANLRTTLTKIIHRAGLTTWPRLLHNLRASRETELTERFPVHVVASWLGNTPKIAMKHYLMTTNEHFAAAVRPIEKAAQKTAQQAHATGTQALEVVYTGTNRNAENTEEYRENYCTKVEDTGLEPPPNSPGNTALGNERGAESGALGAPKDPAFVELAASWPSLSEEVRVAIMAIIRGAKS